MSFSYPDLRQRSLPPQTDSDNPDLYSYDEEVAAEQYAHNTFSKVRVTPPPKSKIAKKPGQSVPFLASNGSTTNYNNHGSSSSSSKTVSTAHQRSVQFSEKENIAIDSNGKLSATSLIDAEKRSRPSNNSEPWSARTGQTSMVESVEEFNIWDRPSGMSGGILNSIFGDGGGGGRSTINQNGNGGNRYNGNYSNYSKNSSYNAASNSTHGWLSNGQYSTRSYSSNYSDSNYSNKPFRCGVFAFFVSLGILLGALGLLIFCRSRELHEQPGDMFDKDLQNQKTNTSSSTSSNKNGTMTANSTNSYDGYMTGSDQQSNRGFSACCIVVSTLTGVLLLSGITLVSAICCCDTGTNGTNCCASNGSV